MVRSFVFLMDIVPIGEQPATHGPAISVTCPVTKRATCHGCFWTIPKHIFTCRWHGHMLETECGCTYRTHHETAEANCRPNVPGENRRAVHRADATKISHRDPFDPRYLLLNAVLLWREKLPIVAKACHHTTGHVTDRHFGRGPPSFIWYCNEQKHIYECHKRGSAHKVRQYFLLQE